MLVERLFACHHVGKSMDTTEHIFPSVADDISENTVYIYSMILVKVLSAYSGNVICASNSCSGSEF